MSDTNESEKSRSKLYDMVVRGKTYRETLDFEMFGEEVEVVLRPLVDAEFLPITALMQELLDIDEEEAIEQIREAKEEAEKEHGEGAPIDISVFDEDFVLLMQKAAKLGIDGESMGHTQEEVDFMVENMVGGYSVELGGEVLDLAGDIRDAERFRGRGASR
ncbi:hypothetical protein [Natronorubrum bangense]|uniref:Uncharacterized protein n=2 Tax=Natronorubrum bangense TaxID=61858 RepID=L9WKC0_9EURY|nr:hypothetical protein [Natronorubrum bangense]ELY49899.1 hypothetical protein C494_07810 [Natronorubrum bangense JCM 10635]QCC55517.1 hypothetical protein DV706_14185 [Natronorubrum bangense]